MIKNKFVEVIDLGLIDFEEAWDYQDNLFKKTIDKKIWNRKHPDSEEPTPNYLLMCEHPHVYTLGKSGDLSNLLLNEEGLKKHDATFYKINRGGDITYHGPGQNVCYPILDLDNFFTDIHKYLRYLEEAVIRTVAEYGIKGERIEGLTGVWVKSKEPNAKPGKICAMGVRTSRWVTMHGIALNVNSKLDYFDHIIPCGIDDKSVTSMEKELGMQVDLKKVNGKLIKHLAEIFSMDLNL